MGGGHGGEKEKLNSFQHLRAKKRGRFKKTDQIGGKNWKREGTSGTHGLNLSKEGEFFSQRRKSPTAWGRGGNHKKGEQLTRKSCVWGGDLCQTATQGDGLAREYCMKEKKGRDGLVPEKFHEIFPDWKGRLSSEKTRYIPCLKIERLKAQKKSKGGKIFTTMGS